MSCVQIRIFARKSAIAAEQGDYALNKTGAILKFFEEYYNISYPLTKSGEYSTMGSRPREEDQQHHPSSTGAFVSSC